MGAQGAVLRGRRSIEGNHRDRLGESRQRRQGGLALLAFFGTEAQFAIEKR